MVICTRCGGVWEQPARAREPFGERTAYCAECGSGQLEEAARCPGCGQWRPQSSFFGGLCSLCGARVRRQYRDVMESAFLPQERAYISDWLDGYWDV